MPSIAQQDYIVIKPKQGRAAQNDAAALSQLAGIKERNGGLGFFDVLIADPINSEMPEEAQFSRVVATYGGESRASGIVLTVYDGTNDEFLNIQVRYFQAQYQGLAAVQQAMDELFGLQNSVPTLEVNDAHILASANDDAFVCIDGKYLLPEKAGGKLASITIAETGPGEDTPFVNITWEDAQKLIGLPIA